MRSISASGRPGATGDAEPAAYAEGAAKVYESGDGVVDLDLVVPAGTIFGFMGPSGSGKTTTIRLFTGVLAPTRGRVRVLGADPWEFGTRQRMRLGYMPQLSVLYPDLSVEENLNFFCSIYGMSWRRRHTLDEVLDLVELGEHRHKKVRAISGGMQRRLSLAATLVHDPELVFLDEPTAGIDPVLRRKFWDRFAVMKEEGRTLFVTTQYVGEAAHFDRVGVLADGRLVIVDTPDGLRRAAFGGEVIRLDLVRFADDDLMASIAGAVGASSIERSSSRGLRLVVDDAAGSLPRLLSWSQEQGVEIESADQHLPPFDDVFVELVERHRADEDTFEASRP